jgi:hypothetical protein
MSVKIKNKLFKTASRHFPGAISQEFGLQFSESDISDHLPQLYTAALKSRAELMVELETR